jgi:NADPH:quinone reductase
MASMRAIVYDTFGGPDVLHLQEVVLPEPGPGQVRVAIYAAGTNPVDAQNRQDGSWADLHPPVIPGSDASGVIDVVGPGVKGFAPGDEAFYMLDFLHNASGTYAEYHVVDAELIACKLQNLIHIDIPLKKENPEGLVQSAKGLSRLHRLPVSSAFLTPPFINGAKWS